MRSGMFKTVLKMMTRHLQYSDVAENVVYTHNINYKNVVFFCIVAVLVLFLGERIIV